MGLIRCNEMCAHQSEGYCRLDKADNAKVSGVCDDCIYFEERAQNKGSGV